MKRLHHILPIVLASLMQALPLCAQQPVAREVTNVKMIGIGPSNILDTYLSPEHYNGFELRFIDQAERHKITTSSTPSSMGLCYSPESSNWTTTLTHQAQISYSKPRSEDANYLYGLYSFILARQRHWHLMGNRLELKAGAQGEIGGGFLYNTRNGNNPAQARAYLNIAPNASARYLFNIRKMRAAVQYEVALPLLGVLFSPNYGQSYYELFSKGNYDHNIVFTTPFNAPTLRQMLSFDFTVKDHIFRIGYLGDFQQAKVNSLKYHAYSHLIILGYVHRFQIQKIRQ